MPERGLPGGAAVGPHRVRPDQIDPDWLYALQHVLPQIDARTYVAEDPASGGAELPFRADTHGEVINAPVPSPARERSKRRVEEENLSADDSPIPSPARARGKRRMEENPSAEIPWYQANPNIDKDFRVFLQHARMVNARLVLEKDGQVVRYEQVPESAAGAFAFGEKEKVAVTSTNNGPASESEFPSESHGPGFSALCQKGLHGLVWPTHIMKRPESRFKERLMQVLSKPFSQREYDQLVHRASIHIAATKERRTRADLEEQVKSTSYPNQLSLLRGFFFWLKNIGHEDQFRPWRDDFTHYKVISSME
ncbi:hypothetical protein BRADI_5g17040v3 [Brachypodium distachyon]|uniref:Uncharacterized protein n=1 Tax=Brachypodium distachyon TaxID=15368 RepID=A0A0Q3P4U7_BRADI|nr:hypothetical protein BRADI_5g17040v3 [Brachypodium distachyon]